VVVGVARGGVAVAAEVARELGLPLTAVDVERGNAHGRRLGATTAHGPPYLLVPERAVEDVLARARRDAERLESRLEHETLPVEGLEALLVDDGAVTGLNPHARRGWRAGAGAGPTR